MYAFMILPIRYMYEEENINKFIIIDSCLYCS
jgi:hypothetical protein